MEFSARALACAILGFVFFGTHAGCEKPSSVKIAALFSFDSVIGRGAKLAMEMAIEDINSDTRVLNGTVLEMIVEDLGCNVFMGSIKAFQVIENEVLAIVGPQSSAIAATISHVANEFHVPVISFAATNPTLSSLQFPYFLRTAPTDASQMAAIADLIDFYGWKEIIAVYVDNEYGRNGINSLGDELAKRISRISHKLPLSPEYNISEISYILNISKSFGPRVYVVHIDPDPRLKFFRIVKKLDMIARDYVWLATDWLSSTLDSFTDKDSDSYTEVLQGVVALRPYIRETVKRKAFTSRWAQKDSSNGNYTAYGLYAYDTMWLVAHAVDRFLKVHGRATFSSTKELRQFANLKVSDGGEFLLEFILNTSFTGLTGRVQLGGDRNRMDIDYEIINIFGETPSVVGYWSNNTGLSVQSPGSTEKDKFNSSLQFERLNNITWPGGEVERPRGWIVTTAEKPLRIGFPKRVSFTEFLTDVNHSHNVRGFCVDLLDEMLKIVPYEVPYIFEPFGDGLENPNYDKLVTMVADDVFDAAVGDIAIVTERMKIVDFTQPFIATGLVVLAPTVNSTSTGWVFAKPFMPEMWCAIAASFVVIAVVIWLLEHRVNDDFRGPPRRQLRTMFLFSASTLFKKNPEKTISTTGKIVMVVWLFLLLVITSSYTASLSSILTVQRLSTCITGLNDLITTGHPIGYQVGSFAFSYMKDSLDINPSRLVALGSPEEYETALRRGPSNGGVAAIVDEIPYVELFLSERKDFGIIGQPFTKSGWGFAFKKGSPLAVDMSTAILKLTENGELQKIQEKWFCKKGCPDERTGQSESDQLHLSSFWALYSVCGTFALVALFFFFIRASRQYIRYRSQLAIDPSPNTLPISSNVIVSRAIHNFFQFIDEKEEAIKKMFTHRDGASTEAQ